MAVSRIEDGKFTHAYSSELKTLQLEYESDCDVLDIEVPTFEAWLVAKLVDLRADFAESIEARRR